MRKLLSLLLVLGFVPLIHAEQSYKQLSRDYDLVFQQFLREKILKLPKNVQVEVFLKHHKPVFGTFEGYQKYDDSFWILPAGKTGLFADEAYDISDIQDVRIFIIRAI